MNKKVILQLKDDGSLYDTKDNYIASPSAETVYFTSKAEITIELVRLGVSINDIVMLKNMELI